MIEREITQAEWPTFGARFSDQHQGWLTEARRRDRTGAVHRLWDDAALERVEIVSNHGQGTLTITAVTPDARGGIGRGAGAVGARVQARSEAPARVVALEMEDGGHAGIRVEDAAGAVTEIRFCVSARPELVDGLADHE